MNLDSCLMNDTKLSKLLNEKFNNIELLKLNFSLYIANKNNKNKFIINLDDIYKWVGFGRKGDAKKLLTRENNEFKVNKDYIIEFNNNKKNIRGGRNNETILLTMKCFKTFCLMARTNESKKFYDYYITFCS